MMAIMTYTGKFKIGERVRYAYHVGAISACMNGRVVTGEGRIEATEEANGTTMYAIGDTLVFEREIEARTK